VRSHASESSLILPGAHIKIVVVRDPIQPPYDCNISCPEEIVSFWHKEIATQAWFVAEQETLISISLNTKNVPIAWNLASIGSLNESIAHPREIFRAAIALAASASIVVHNHPGGDPSPSEKDNRTTRRLNEAGRILGIFLLDHVIIGRDNYFSFKEAGLIT
jgi:DNA repair protein RadC